MLPTLGVNDKIAGISLEPFLAFNAQARPEVNVCIDEAKSAAAQLAQGTQVIFRWSDDDHAHERHKPKEFVQRLHAMAPPGCVLQLGNEPGTASIELLDSWTVSALDECERLGRKAALYGWATGEPEPEHWPRLRRSMQRAKQGGHWVNIHQYFDAFVARSLRWHIGREVDVYAAYGDATPQIVIGELGCAVNYDPFAGWQSYLTAEQYAAELVEAQKVYAPRGIPACVFLWGPWDKTTTFDIRGEAVVQDAIIRLNAAVNAAEGEDDMAGPAGWAQITTNSVGVSVNVRQAPSLTAQPIASVKTGAWVKPQGQPVNANGHAWQKVILENCAGGYISLNVVRLGEKTK